MPAFNDFSLFVLQTLAYKQRLAFFLPLEKSSKTCAIRFFRSCKAQCVLNSGGHGTSRGSVPQ